jgi:general transcription factor 3C polypeptide 3 (transcription factor C subunit 4)
MIKLSLALGYLHYALKRQADNRHHILMQGFAMLLEYYDDRNHSSSASERQEAEYNVAHAYHLLGLTHLAIPYYERCLDLSTAVQTGPPDRQQDDFAFEAAVNLQGLWAASGNVKKARDITEKWLVMG